MSRCSSASSPGKRPSGSAGPTRCIPSPAGKALAVLGRSAEAYGQAWHLPTTKEPLTGADFARLACELAGHPDKLQVMPRWMMKLLKLFIPVLHENEEMMHQFDYDYRFDSSKIEATYGLQPTAYRQGIGACLETEVGSGE